MVTEKAIAEMKEIFKEIPYGIDHTLRVLKNAEAIAGGEGITGKESELISLAAILHDIGAVEALRKYGSIAGEFQEEEGPAVARDILERIGYEPMDIDRICYIVGNHHTPSKIDGLDFQILWEADLIENLIHTDIIESKARLKEAIDSNFRTSSGIKLITSLIST